MTRSAERPPGPAAGPAGSGLIAAVVEVSKERHAVIPHFAQRLGQCMAGIDGVGDEAGRLAVADTMQGERACLGLPVFAAAFSCQEGDAMVRPEADRVSIW